MMYNHVIVMLLSWKLYLDVYCNNDKVSVCMTFMCRSTVYCTGFVILVKLQVMNFVTMILY